jgi:DNA polymerase (family X)
VDNLTISRIFAEIAQLLELKAENPFKIRAYWNAADVIAHAATALEALSDAERRKIPGIGKDLSAKIREICETGDARLHRELLAEFPASVLELLRLQGIGPRTAAQLYLELRIGSLDELEAAARDGRLLRLKGMGPRKQEQILKAVEDRRKHSGRHLMADAVDAVTELLGELRAHCRDTEFIPVGSLRRGCDTVGDVDVLAIGEGPGALDAFTAYALVDRVLGRGDTKASVLLRGGLQADLRLVAPAARGAAMQYFTGSKSHNIALRDRAAAAGYKLNEYGLFGLSDDTRVAGDSEEGLYRALGLRFIPPELREGRGELDAAESGSLPNLLERGHIRGDLHTHSTETDGRDDVETMARAARAAGLEYVAITDHSRALAMAGGLNEARALAHARRIRETGKRLDGITLLAGVECDILPDGTLDLADDCLAQLDFVVASVHSAFNQDENQMTDRLVRAIECPYVDAIGHPTGRLLLRREPYRLDMDRVTRAAVRHGVAFEINCQIDRLDLDDVHARAARQLGARFVISTDAHSRNGFELLKWGAIVARRAWLTPTDVLNVLPVEDFRARLHRAQSNGSAQARPEGA